jgi:hypothetical protein
MAQACREEVLALHKFLEGWYAGRAAADDATFARCADALAPEFRLINPDGELTERDDLLARIRGAHAQYHDTYFHIRIEEVEQRDLADGLCHVTYQEWQETDGFWTARWTTALMRACDDAPGGVQWLHVHETWITDEE